MTRVVFSEENNEATISGEINFSTVGKIRKQGDELIRQFQGESIHFNFGQVTRADITGLALVIAWLRACTQRDIKLYLSNLPASILRIAEVCDVKDMIISSHLSQ